MTCYAVFVSLAAVESHRSWPCHTGCVALGSLLGLLELHFPQLQMELLGLHKVRLRNGLTAEPGLSAFHSDPKSLSVVPELVQLKGELGSELSRKLLLLHKTWLWEGSVG